VEKVEKEEEIIEVWAVRVVIFLTPMRAFMRVETKISLIAKEVIF
jgi:hypothetical protein